MSLISDEQLLNYNKEGLIPGPVEEERDFLKRVEYCLKLKQEMPLLLQNQASDFQIADVSQGFLEKACTISASIYDIAPTWIPFFFSNYKLAPWHGGCAWIFQLNEESPTAAFFQLRKNFYHSSRYLTYSRDELIVHELSHVGRMLFQEPKFEEVLAYSSSPSRFRRWFGPIIQSSWESTVFVLALCLVIVIDLFFAGSDQRHLVWIELIPLVLLGLGLVRLWRKQKTFSQCLKNLQELLQSEHKARSVIYRLTDQEINLFSRIALGEIRQYAEEQKTGTLRWRLIHEAYFNTMVYTKNA